MPFTLTMPKLSPTMEEGTIVKWHKKEGDHVKVGDTLFEVATDKATVEHQALDEGWVRKILINEGNVAVVNQAVAIFTEKQEESIEGYKPEGISLSSLSKKEESTAEINSSSLEERKSFEKVSSTTIQQPKFAPEAPLENYDFPFLEGLEFKRVIASPLARKLAKERNIDLTTVKGSGSNHRIMSRDLDLGQRKAFVSFKEEALPKAPPGSYEEESLSVMRKVIAERLQQSKMFIPHFYIHQDVCCNALSDIREQLKEGEIKVSFNDLMIRACSLTLKKHPEINSGFNAINSTIIRFKTIDISIAVSLEGGLITPIIRYADFKNVSQITSEVKYLAERARLGKLAREEYMGGSFTISNLGMYGISDFAGIINPPQAALLAVGAIEEKPAVVRGEIQPAKMMRLTLSCDHRVIDGADGAQFLKSLKWLLENPALLLI